MTMNNSEMPAIPCNIEGFEYDGLTKREHFAGLAMQSLILAIPAWEALGYPCPDDADTVKESYKYADLMAAEPDKSIN
jgi:hypothetical protein